MWNDTVNPNWIRASSIAVRPNNEFVDKFVDKIVNKLANEFLAISQARRQPSSCSGLTA